MIKNINNIDVKFIKHETVVIGTGCAGFNAADTLFDRERDVAIITEGIGMGTSRNTGSDKQTYYKLSMASDNTDSIYELAENLFAGGSVNGDTALIEAACSVRSFMKLVTIGVPFPTNKYGEYVGYKTDHDPRQRATSCGPLTSKIMTEKLEKVVNTKNIPIYDKMQAINILTDDGKVTGVVCLDMSNEAAITVFLCNNVILATGGPSIVYKNSVYPTSQTGMSGIAINAGAKTSNMQEWQYGLASTKFRWNVSGTYQQVIPRYIAIDKDGGEREFLPEYFENPTEGLNQVFLKGYQWPFDTEKIEGSSIIDIIVHKEIFEKGNRVFMDFRQDPIGLEKFENLSTEAYTYLEKSNALLDTPIKRLQKMNSKAIELYKDHGIDIVNEPLEVSVSAQHCNGGIDVDLNWESCVKGLYVAGEAAGTFGVSRPGGSALNSTQVGSLRAAANIARSKVADVADLADTTQIEKIIADIETIKTAGTESTLIIRNEFQEKMSVNAGHMRSIDAMNSLASEVNNAKNNLFADVKTPSATAVAQTFKTYDMLTVQGAMLSAMGLTAEACSSRGSALIVGEDGFVKGNGEHRAEYVETKLDGEKFTSKFVPVRPLIKTDDWFENIWNEFNELEGLN